MIISNNFCHLPDTKNPLRQIKRAWSAYSRLSAIQRVMSGKRVLLKIEVLFGRLFVHIGDGFRGDQHPVQDRIIFCREDAVPF